MEGSKMWKNILAIVVSGLITVSFVFAQETEPAKEKAKVFNLYTDRQSSDNHYIPSGWM